MNCPFCHHEMDYKKGKQHGQRRVDEEACWHEACQFHKMLRYSRTIATGILDSERIILTDTLYISINHHHDETTISRLDIVAISDHVILPKALKLDLSDIPKVIDKIKILLMFS